MGSVTLIVTNIELVVVHITRLLLLPEKKQSAGEGGTLFGLLMTSDLAVFQTIVNLKKPTVNLNELMIGNFFFTLFAKQSGSLLLHHSILSF